MSSSPNIDLSSLLSSYNALVTYIPLKTEVSFRNFSSLPTDVYEIPPRASIDPYEEAKKVQERFSGASVAILLPGKEFDLSGTRRGQGGGWYDRFLSSVPRHWFRVGFCYQHQVSTEPLTRNEWDEPVDALCVVDGDTLTLHRF